MKKLLLASAAMTGLATAGFAAGHEEIKLGIILGFTGPIESLTPSMADAAELAMSEVTESGLLLGGASVTAVRADSTCIDSGAAQAAAERLVTSDGVKGIMGADCSGVTGAILQNVALANGVVMISPSATSPGLSHMNNEDEGLFFRTAPSDARQGVVMTEVLTELGITEVAVTYTNNDYGKGLADSFQAAFEAAGGTVTINAAHEDGKADYSAEVGALAAAGGPYLGNGDEQAVLNGKEKILVVQNELVVPETPPVAKRRRGPFRTPQVVEHISNERKVERHSQRDQHPDEQQQNCWGLE